MGVKLEMNNSHVRESREKHEGVSGKRRRVFGGWLELGLDDFRLKKPPHMPC